MCIKQFILFAIANDFYLLRDTLPLLGKKGIQGSLVSENNDLPITYKLDIN